MRDERWLSEEIREGNPWLDQPDQASPEMQFPIYMLERQAFFLRLVRRCHAKMSNIFDRSTLAETWFFSVSMMLISFATFWMSCISVILAGSVLILMFLNTSMVKSGRRMQKFAKSIRTRLSDARADQETASAKHRATFTSAETPVSNSST